MRFSKGEIVEIFHPGDRYHGKRVRIDEVDAKDERGLNYGVRLIGHNEVRKNIPLWLPYTRLRRLKPKTLYDLVPGEYVQNSNGLRYQVVEPTEPIVFLQIVGGPPIVQYMQVREMVDMGFSIVKKEDDDAADTTNS